MPSKHLSRNVSDAELARALNERHPEAPRVAIERFSPCVQAVWWRAFHSADQLQDAQQEVFSSLFRDVCKLRDPSLLRPFVLGIARNTVLAERRRRRKRPMTQLEADVASVALSGVAESATARHALSRLTQLLRRLRARERETFVHRFIDRMTVNEVAEALGVSGSTVRRSLSRAWERVVAWASMDPYLTDYFRGGRVPSWE